MRIQDSNGIKGHYYYEVDAESKPLGVGGMGKVLRGLRINEDTGTRKEVAVKFLYSDLPPHVIERARRESSVHIQHENLVEMIDFVQIVDTNGVQRNHVVSEFLHGVILSDLLKGNVVDYNDEEISFAANLYELYRADKFEFTCTIAKGILSGLMTLHDMGYIHRDLDPSNIMITGDGKIKIIDFGISKRISALDTQDRKLTSTGQFVGKAAYAAPELVRGFVNDQNVTTDIYAVGIILYQLYTGRLPFEGAQNDVLEMQLRQPLPLKNIDNKALRNIIQKATEKRQIDRYQSVAEFRADMDRGTVASATDIDSDTMIWGTAAGIVGFGLGCVLRLLIN